MVADIVIIDCIAEILFQLLFLTGVLLLACDVTTPGKRRHRREYEFNIIKYAVQLNTWHCGWLLSSLSALTSFKTFGIMHLPTAFERPTQPRLKVEALRSNAVLLGPIGCSFRLKFVARSNRPIPVAASLANRSTSSDLRSDLQWF